MRHHLFLRAATAMACLALAPSVAAADTPRHSLGFQAGPLMGRTDDTDEISGVASGFARYRLGENVEAEASAGYGRLCGGDFSTHLGLVGFRFLLAAPVEARWQPLTHIGLAAIRHDIEEFPAARSSNAESIAWGAAVPVGLGLRAELGPRLALELSGTFTYTLRDDLDGRTDVKGNDWLFSGGMGLAFGRFAAPAPRSAPVALPRPAPAPEPEIEPEAAPVPEPEPEPVAGPTPVPAPVLAGADRDGDGLTDLEEVERYYTNPLMADTDLDLVPDIDEVRVHGTDPNRPDTDGDGTDDGTELLLQRDPLTPDAPAPRQILSKPRPFRMPVITFGWGGAALSARSRLALDKVASYLQANPEMRLSVHGYADSLGGSDANLGLSLRRCRAVRDYLVSRGIDTERLDLQARGEEDPVADNSTLFGRRANRRVELVPLR